MIVEGLYRQIVNRVGAGDQKGQFSEAAGPVACVTADTKLILLAIAIGIVSAVALIGIELLVLYKDILVFIPEIIVETLRMIVTPL
ncbi:hypothetical protein B0G80_8667 [Paraburkholderia sp. BL6669N2]|uniref:hypothetical protein n=1 Tax=Paraburkholderia sp. BL6669N2 TaxID=1938807 RepID=UPI000E240EFD|nr:hypothetical protein [Paraburkholderia sp. BL6669N2]REG52144.1 hypothetical protein B0G80_8667 [Paraburkholderia sp. BL6669N2]